MKAFLKILIIVFLFSGLIASTQSCEDKLSGTKDSGIPELTANEEIQVNSGTSSSDLVVTITNCNLNGWERHGAVGAQGTIDFVNEPSTHQLGNGSVRFYCPDAKFIRLKNNQFVGTRLSSISELSYSTYVEQSGSIADNIFIVLQIDINDDGVFDFPVVFNPTFQTEQWIEGKGSDQGPIQRNVWQNWDVLNGVWWRGPAPDPYNDGELFNLTTLIDQYPNATIMNQGESGPGSIRINCGAPVFVGIFNGYADNFKIGINGLTTVYDFEETTANAGPDQNVILGYGPNCTTLTGIAVGGVAPHSYSWSPGGSTPDQASIEVCPEFTTTYTLTVTDANGCSRTDDVTVFVNDVRCGNNMDKVKVCHKGKEICIDSKDVEDHLAHGDLLGDC